MSEHETDDDFGGALAAGPPPRLGRAAGGRRSEEANDYLRSLLAALASAAGKVPWQGACGGDDFKGSVVVEVRFLRDSSGGWVPTTYLAVRGSEEPKP